MDSTTLRQALRSTCRPLYHYLQLRRLLKDLPPCFTTRGSEFVMHDRPSGFFSIFLQVIGAVAVCRHRRHNLRLQFHAGLYRDPARDPHWWGYYFDSSEYCFTSRPREQREIAAVPEQMVFSDFGKRLNAHVANRLIRAAGIRVRPELQEKVRKFLGDGAGKWVGVHYRGTDKATEAPIVPYPAVIEQMGLLPGAPEFFIATDEIGFLDLALREFPGRIRHHPFTRSADTRPVHLESNGTSPYALGEEALVDCLTLAGCRMLLRTDSNLSLATAHFNPRMRVVNLTERHLAGRNA